MDEPVVDMVLCRLLVSRTKIAATTASMRIRPAIAMPIAKLLCDMQKLFGSSIVCKRIRKIQKILISYILILINLINLIYHYY